MKEIKKIVQFFAELGLHAAILILTVIFFIYGLFTQNQWRLFTGKTNI